MRLGGMGWVAAVLIAVACGGGQSGGGDLGSGGMSASGGGLGATGGDGTGALGQVGGAPGTSGGSSTGGAQGAALTEYEACVEYVTTVCNRRDFECGGVDATSDPCPTSTELCPDSFFSEGSSWTVETLLACAEEWRTASCELLNTFRVPVCARPPGERKLGESCRFSNQCESYGCNGNPLGPDCGQCAPVLDAGDSCEDDLALCDDGLECMSDPGATDSLICQPIPVFNLPPGAACERYGQCQTKLGYYCIDDICQERPGIGDPCPTFNCASGAYCDPDSATCQPLPEAGEPCLELETGLFCRSGLQCDGSAPDGPTCGEGLPLGEDCTRAMDGEKGAPGCGLGLTCLCDDDVCESGHCVQKRYEGESCDDSALRCVQGTACESGACQGQETQGLFRETCGE